MMAGEVWSWGVLLTGTQHILHHAFDHGALDTLPSVCNKIVLLLHFTFNFPVA